MKMVKNQKYEGKRDITTKVNMVKNVSIKNNLKIRKKREHNKKIIGIKKLKLRKECM